MPIRENGQMLDNRFISPAAFRLVAARPDGCPILRTRKAAITTRIAVANRVLEQKENWAARAEWEVLETGDGWKVIAWRVRASRTQRVRSLTCLGVIRS